MLNTALAGWLARSMRAFCQCIDGHCSAHHWLACSRSACAFRVFADDVRCSPCGAQYTHANIVYNERGEEITRLKPLLTSEQMAYLFKTRQCATDRDNVGLQAGSAKCDDVGRVLRNGPR